MADYSRNNRRHGNDSFVRSTAAGIVRDSTYDDRTRGLYNVAALNAALKSGSARRGSCAPARSTPTTTCTTKRSTATSAPRGGETLDAASYVTDYTEHITAAYAAATLKKGIGTSWRGCAANIPAPRVTAATCASVISASFPTPT